MIPSTVRVAEAACAAEGVTLDALRSNRPKNTGSYTPRRSSWGTIFARVVARCRAQSTPPSLPELAAVFQTGTSTIIGAARRGFTMLDAGDTVALIDHHGIDGLVELGKAVASGLKVHKPSRPMFDDGEDNG